MIECLKLSFFFNVLVLYFVDFICTNIEQYLPTQNHRHFLQGKSMFFFSIRLKKTQC